MKTLYTSTAQVRLILQIKHKTIWIMLIKS